MAHQIAVTIVTTIKSGQIENLKLLLKTMREDPAHNDVIPFGAFRSIHFARLLVLDESVDLQGVSIPPQLVFLGDCDAPMDRLLAELVYRAARGLDRIFSHCTDYPPRAGLPEHGG